VIQIDGTKRQVYIKLIDNIYVIDLLHATKGQSEYKHNTGEITIVTISMAGMGNKRVRIANLPPDVPEKCTERSTNPLRDGVKTFKRKNGREFTGML
jgi:hypothetical protein